MMWEEKQSLIHSDIHMKRVLYISILSIYAQYPQQIKKLSTKLYTQMGICKWQGKYQLTNIVHNVVDNLSLTTGGDRIFSIHSTLIPEIIKSNLIFVSCLQQFYWHA